MLKICFIKGSVQMFEEEVFMDCQTFSFSVFFQAACRLSNVLMFYFFLSNSDIWWQTQKCCSLLYTLICPTFLFFFLTPTLHHNLQPPHNIFLFFIFQSDMSDMSPFTANKAKCTSVCTSKPPTPKDSKEPTWPSCINGPGFETWSICYQCNRMNSTTELEMFVNELELW